MPTSTRRASLVIAALSIAGLSMLAGGTARGIPGCRRSRRCLDDWHDAASRADGVPLSGT